MSRIRVIDSHTAGEPTRLILDGGPAITAAGAAAQRDIFQRDFDPIRAAVVGEPRGSDVLVGAWLGPTSTPGCHSSVVFFNNVGYLGMCGHGMIGVVHTLAWLGKITPGKHDFETPVGVVTATLHDDGRVSIRNVPSRRVAHGVEVDVPGHGRVIGDIAWGGNFFYLVPAGGRDLVVGAVADLTAFTTAIRTAIHTYGYPEVDHVELIGPPVAGGNARNFVLCPGLAYDRSPCGTGTSAKIACLAADGNLAEGETWIQESILGTKFHGSFQWDDSTTGSIIPTITGRAHVTAEATLILSPDDPLRHGIPPA